MPGTPRPGRTAAAIARSEQLRPVLTALVAEGIGCREISRRLAEDHGITSSSGRPLNTGTIRDHLRRLRIQTAYQAGTGDPALARANKAAGIARAIAEGRNPGLSPGTAAARQRRSEAAAAWRQALAPTLQELAALGCSRKDMLMRLRAAGVTAADGRPLSRATLQRACAAAGLSRSRNPEAAADAA